MEVEASTVSATTKQDTGAPGCCVQRKFAHTPRNRGQSIACVGCDAQSRLARLVWLLPTCPSVHILLSRRLRSSPPLGCSRCPMPIGWRAKPDVETTDWRARRGRTAQRVRREGTAVAVPYPYPM